MILDYENLFSDDQVVTATADSEHLIDLGADDPLVQQLVERGLDVWVQITKAMTAGGTDLTVVVEVDDDVTFGSSTIVVQSAAVVAATLIAGYQFLIGTIPAHISERYIQLVYTVGGSNFSGGGTLSAGLVIDRQTSGVSKIQT